ncbi:MAG: fibrobacter succinogenes major paralogous domain-containing protein [Bacteroidetes bacterium]|nr:fibrobacter succinogenes major paralogous domain-containing protein [Bacteroidota bacterium]
MKRTFTILLALMFSVALLSQSPQRLSYQAVIRNSSGQVIASKSVGMRISILKGSATGESVYTETHTPTSTAGGIVTVEIGGGTPVSGTFTTIDWSSGNYFVKTETDPEGGNSYTITGTSQLLSVPFAFMADKANKATVAEKLNNPVDKMQIRGQTDNFEEALFEIKNKNGQTVFAVFNEGVRIYVDNGSAKGSKGGFAIGGFGSSKAPSQDLFVVNPDSIRAYVNTDPAAKGSKGGFAIGGFGSSKAIKQDLLIVHPDSIRLYIDSDAAAKGSKGGFAIGGFSNSKAGIQDLFIVNPDSIRAYINTDPAVKGSKGGFAIGGFGSSKSVSQDLLVVHPDSIRLYIDTDATAKGSKGGFAIGGFSNSKAGIQDLFIVNPDSIRAYINTNPAGKGSKGGFAIGGFGSSKSSSEEYLRVTRDSTRVYLNVESAKGKKGGFAVGGFGASKSTGNDYLFLNADSTRFYVRQQGDQSSSFDIIGFDQSQQRKSLFQAGPDTVNIQGVLSVQNNLVVSGNVQTQGEVQQTGSLTDISGNIYKTITIGNQEWMAENLKTTKYNDGSDIPVVTDNTAWSLLTTGAYSEYENNPVNVNTYGRLYNWHAVNTNMLCPQGWHVPTDMEFADFSMYLMNNGYGYMEMAGETAKSISSTTNWAPSALPPSPGNRPDLNNATGFDGKPAGQRNPDGSYIGLTLKASWWTLNSGGSFDAMYNGLSYDQGMLMNSINMQVTGYSIRCIKGNL